MRLVKRLMIASLTALSMGLLAFPAPATAARCSNVPHDAHTSGGEAHWTVACSGGKVYVDGWVKDTDADGQCARVRAIVGSSGSHEVKACPKNHVTSFHWSGRGNSADVYLFEE